MSDPSGAIQALALLTKMGFCSLNIFTSPLQHVQINTYTCVATAPMQKEKPKDATPNKYRSG